MSLRRRRASRRRDGEDGGLDLTSLLDVIFNLIFFFIVATNLREDERFFELVLPQASEGQTVREPERLPEIAVSKDGTLALNGQTLPPEQLEEQLKTLLSRDPSRRAVMSADADATVQQTTVALDILQRAGVTNLVQRVKPQR